MLKTSVYLRSNTREHPLVKKKHMYCSSTKAGQVPDTLCSIYSPYAMNYSSRQQSSLC
jgi:hypothetical protein